MGTAKRFGARNGVDNLGYTSINMADPVNLQDGVTKNFLINFVATGSPVLLVAGRAGNVVLTQADIAGLTTTSSPTFTAVTAANFNGNATSATLAGNVTGVVAIGNGGTGASNAIAGLAALGGQPLIGYTPFNAASVGVANGAASLDATGHVPSSQLPASVVGDMDYVSAWNPATNVPALASGVGTKGQYYKCSVAGTTNLDGNSVWNAGDFAAFNGTTWDKFAGSAAEVTMVAGRIGAVVLAQADIAGLTTASSPVFTAVTAGSFTGALIGNASTATSAVNVTGVVQIANGGTGASTAAAGLAALGGVNAAQASAAAPVQLVAGRAGNVVLTVADIGGLSAASTLAIAQTTYTNGFDATIAFTTTTAAANQVVDSVSDTVVRGLDYTIVVGSGGVFQISKIMIIQDGTNVEILRYGDTDTGADLGSFDAQLSGGNIQLLFSPVYAATTLKAKRTAIDV